MSIFYYVNKSVLYKDSLLHYITRAGRTLVESDFQIVRDKQYPYCLIHYVLKGSGYVIHRGIRYEIKKGDLFVLSPHESHSYYTNPEDLLLMNWIEFAGGDTIRLANAVLNNVPFIIEEPLSSRANKYMLRIFALIHKKPEDNAILISKIIYSLLLNLLDTVNNSAVKTLSQTPLDNISKALHYIDNNIGTDLSIEKLARVTGYSSAYFARLFSKVTGITPAQYVLAKRINEAKDCLGRTNMSVEIIANTSGFCNTSHFIKNFKNLEGCTPTEYRKQVRAYGMG